MAQKNRELRALIYARYDKEADFSKELGWPRQKLNLMTNGKRLPDVKELNQMAGLLGVSIEQLTQIFLNAKSQNCDKRAM